VDELNLQAVAAADNGDRLTTSADNTNAKASRYAPFAPRSVSVALACWMAVGAKGWELCGRVQGGLRGSHRRRQGQGRQEEKEVKLTHAASFNPDSRS